MPSLELIRDKLRCPECYQNIEIRKDEIVCTNCMANYPIRKGVADFIGNDKTNSGAIENETMKYEERYQSYENAVRYYQKYEGKSRMRTALEIKVIRKLLARYKKVKSILDMPCGGGRFSGVLSDYCELLVGTDIALGQIMYNMEHSNVPVSQTWLRASAFKIPLTDKSIDGAVCIRLSHHFHSLKEVENLLAELFRVTRYFVILSFSDANSLKSIYRRLKGIPLTNRFTKKNLAQIALRNNARLISCPAMAPFRSHHYALMEKD